VLRYGSSYAALTALTESVRGRVKIWFRVGSDDVSAIRARGRRLDRGGALGPDCSHQRADSDELHRTFQVVGQNVQAHLGTDAPSVRWPYDIPSTFPLFNALPASVFGPVTYSVLCIPA